MCLHATHSSSPTLEENQSHLLNVPSSAVNQSVEGVHGIGAENSRLLPSPHRRISAMKSPRERSLPGKVREGFAMPLD